MTKESKLVPGLLLAHSWEPSMDPTGWWMSEKLDGVRAYWDGKRFITRLGGTFDAPYWFTQYFPHHTLDGEIWGGRGKFQETVGICKTKNRSPDLDERWKDLKYVVFDSPDEYGPIEKRIDALKQGLHFKSYDYMDDLKNKYIELIQFTLCEGFDHLNSSLISIEEKGGEGLMLRMPGSLYERKRSHTLLKVKTFHDAEARVIAHLEGKGRNVGRMGAVEVEMPNGKTFSVGSGFTDAQRLYPPAVGSIITYRFQELSSYGIPRFPTFVRIKENV